MHAGHSFGPPDKPDAARVLAGYRAVVAQAVPVPTISRGKCRSRSMITRSNPSGSASDDVTDLAVKDEPHRHYR